MPTQDTQYRTARGAAEQEGLTATGGRNTTVALYEVRDLTERISLYAPYFVFFGIIDRRAKVYVDAEPDWILEAGESIVVSPLQAVSVDVPEADAARCVVIHLEPNQVETIAERTNPSPRPSSTAKSTQDSERAYSSVARTDSLHRLMQMIPTFFRQDASNRDVLIDLSVKQILVLLLQSSAQSLLVDGFSRQTPEGGIAAAVQYIQEHLHRHISIDELLEEACMSKSSFYRHFGNEFDVSPLEYITHQRVVRAREMLADPQNTVTEVCHALGFNSTSYFIDMFKEHEGVTPKQYQLQVTESNGRA
jgi:AraC-like DNA-binding protein